jgi:cell division protein FtsB
MVRVLASLGIVLLVASQLRLWFSDVGILARRELIERLDQEEARAGELAARNARLAEEVVAMQSGLSVVEAKARAELGMIKEGETFFLVTPK